jgi:hypothetical protein
MLKAHNHIIWVIQDRKSKLFEACEQQARNNLAPLRFRRLQKSETGKNENIENQALDGF